MTLHKSKGKLYIELPVKNMGREMLIASTISEASDPDLGSIGYKPQPPMHVRFNLIDSTVYMSEVSVLPDFDKSNEQMAHAVKLSSMDPILNAYKIVCFNNDSTAVVFDASNLFTSNYEPLAPIKSGSMAASTSRRRSTAAAPPSGKSKPSRTTSASNPCSPTRYRPT